eukprot:maker-scaffold_16-snap-gene-1.23-mRNA-1 protein AED:0.06 eAED:0.06 QI:48/1/1/1/0.5/0.33/3/515/139
MFEKLPKIFFTETKNTGHKRIQKMSNSPLENLLQEQAARLGNELNRLITEARENAEVKGFLDGANQMLEDLRSALENDNLKGVLAIIGEMYLMVTQAITAAMESETAEALVTLLKDFKASHLDNMSSRAEGGAGNDADN